MRRRGWRQNGDLHGNPFRGLPPDALHREDHGVWITLVEAFCAALKGLYPSSRKRKRRAEDGSMVETEEVWSEKIDLVNERLASLAVLACRWLLMRASPCRRCCGTGGTSLLGTPPPR